MGEKLADRLANRPFTQRRLRGLFLIPQIFRKDFQRSISNKIESNLRNPTLNPLNLRLKKCRLQNNTPAKASAPSARDPAFGIFDEMNEMRDLRNGRLVCRFERAERVRHV